MISVPTVQSCELISVPTAYSNGLVAVPRVYGNGGFVLTVYGSELIWNHSYYTFYLNIVSHIPFTSVNFLTTHPDSSVLRFNVTYFIFHFCHVTFYNSQLFMKIFPLFPFFLFWTLSLVNPTDTSLFNFLIIDNVAGSYHLISLPHIKKKRCAWLTL